MSMRIEIVTVSLRFLRMDLAETLDLDTGRM
jgi:hypothetical protein